MALGILRPASKFAALKSGAVPGMGPVVALAGGCASTPYGGVRRGCSSPDELPVRLLWRCESSSDLPSIVQV
jgi:hypothetical protein